MAAPAEPGRQGGPGEHQKAPIPPQEEYQDRVESNDSRLKATFDELMDDVKEAKVSYRNAVVLLLSWDPMVDDLHVGAEVDKLRRVFSDTLKYETVTRYLTKERRKTPQSQVHFHLAEFVRDHDDLNTLLIVYYAGHGKPGDANGTIILEGDKSLARDDNNKLHEIVWNSAEHIIMETLSDVLVIFDCCHAGELVQNVRSNVGHRTFEFLAATSAKSTTMQPGRQSFTTALIWALKELVASQTRFPIQELLTKIFEAPHFPKDQCPRLGERGVPSLRRIILAPLHAADKTARRESHPIQRESDVKQDLAIRFIFNKILTDQMVRVLAMGLRKVVSEGDLEVAAVLWEGSISFPPTSHRLVNAVSGIRAGKKWRAKHKRNQSSGAISPADKTARKSKTGTPESEEIQALTPEAAVLSIEPHIGEDQGISDNDKTLNVETLGTSLPGSNYEKRKIDESIQESDARATVPPAKRTRRC